jgi:hypothetical protein
MNAKEPPRHALAQLAGPRGQRGIARLLGLAQFFVVLPAERGIGQRTAAREFVDLGQLRGIFVVPRRRRRGVLRPGRRPAPRRAPAFQDPGQNAQAEDRGQSGRSGPAQGDQDRRQHGLKPSWGPAIQHGAGCLARQVPQAVRSHGRLGAIEPILQAADQPHRLVEPLQALVDRSRLGLPLPAQLVPLRVRRRRLDGDRRRDDRWQVRPVGRNHAGRCGRSTLRTPRRQHPGQELADATAIRALDRSPVGAPEDRHQFALLVEHRPARVALPGRARQAQCLGAFGAIDPRVAQRPATVAPVSAVRAIAAASQRFAGARVVVGNGHRSHARVGDPQGGQVPRRVGGQERGLALAPVGQRHGHSTHALPEQVGAGQHHVPACQVANLAHVVRSLGAGGSRALRCRGSGPQSFRADHRARPIAPYRSAHVHNAHDGLRRRLGARVGHGAPVAGTRARGPRARQHHGQPCRQRHHAASRDRVVGTSTSHLRPPA